MDSQSFTNTIKTTVLLAGLGGLLVMLGTLILGKAGIVLGLLLGLGLALPEALAVVAAHRPTAGPQTDVQSDLLVALAAQRPLATTTTTTEPAADRAQDRDDVPQVRRDPGPVA